jgi:hypothetical protein
VVRINFNSRLNETNLLEKDRKNKKGYPVKDLKD